MVLVFFSKKKINNLLHRARWQAVVVTQGYYLSFERRKGNQVERERESRATG